MSGSTAVNRPLGGVMGRLRFLLASAGGEIVTSGKNYIDFRHGAFPAWKASMLPKRGLIRLNPFAGVTIIRYRVGPPGPARVALILMGVLFCWTILAPVAAWLALVTGPRRFMESLLADV